jgi:hypothetical protein
MEVALSLEHEKKEAQLAAQGCCYVCSELAAELAAGWLRS